MNQTTPRPWRQGETLLTPQTEKLNVTQWAANESAERVRVFSSFVNADKGRSRKLVAVCKNEDDAALIVKAVNTFDRAKAALEELFAMVNGECPRLLNEDSGGNARLYMKIEQVLKEEA